MDVEMKEPKTPPNDTYSSRQNDQQILNKLTVPWSKLDDAIKKNKLRYLTS